MATTQPLSNQQANDKYLKSCGTECPNCGSTDIVGQEITVEDGYAFQEISCPECDSEWEDVYVLVQFRGLIHNPE